MTQKVLLVDDEPRVLDGYRRNLRRSYDIVTAVGPKEGLSTLSDEGPFAVVVSDLQMPEMDGIEFLSEVRAQAPDTVRLMLTGQADLNASIRAVNTGRVFRFLTKPCPADDLAASLDAALEQYRLIQAERELVEGTLRGTVGVLADLMGLIDEKNHAQMTRVKEAVLSLEAALGLGRRWELELAATLHLLGTITLPKDTAARLRSGQMLTDADKRMVERYPQAGHNLLAKIPRLGRVAEIIKDHQTPPPELPSRLDVEGDADFVKVGAHLLNVALTFDRLVAGGMSAANAVAQMRTSDHAGAQGPILDALEQLHSRQMRWEERALPVSALNASMEVMDGVYSKTGSLLVPAKQRLTGPLLERLHNFASGMGVQEPIRVRIPL